MRITGLLLGVSLGVAVAGRAGAVDIDRQDLSRRRRHHGRTGTVRPWIRQRRFQVRRPVFELHAKKRSIPMTPTRPSDSRTASTPMSSTSTVPTVPGRWRRPSFTSPSRRTAAVRVISASICSTSCRRVDNNTFMVNGAVPAGDQPLQHPHSRTARPPDGFPRGRSVRRFRWCSRLSARTAQAICPADMEHMHATEICGLANAVAAGKHCPGVGHVHPEGKAYAIHGHEVWLEPVPYDIEVPASHPASLNWFHPHAHEISSPQVAAGLAGVLTIGTLCSDYSLPDDYCVQPSNGEPTLNPDRLRERVLMLKDFEVFDATAGRGRRLNSAEQRGRLSHRADVHARSREKLASAQIIRLPAWPRTATKSSTEDFAHLPQTTSMASRETGSSRSTGRFSRRSR